MLSPCQAKAHGADLGISPRQRRKKRKESLAFSSPRSGKRQVDVVKAPERNDRAEKDAAVPRSKEKQNRAAKSRGKNDYSTAEMPNGYA